MSRYLDDVLSGLTLSDMSILAILHKLEADVPFKSVSRGMLMDNSMMSRYKLRTSLYRLEATRLISSIRNGKSSNVYMTKYGALALNKNLKGDV